MVVHDQVPTLRPEALLLASAHLAPRQRRARIIDLWFRDQLDPDRLRVRAGVVGPLPGKADLLRMLDELTHHRIESIFQDLVADELEELGYRPQRSTRRLTTGSGATLEIDVPLPRWQIAVEPDGDSYHRTRDQRRSDRRRLAAYAGTDWRPVPVDWRDWHLDRDAVLRAIDAAIVAQRLRGIGTDHRPPEASRSANARPPPACGERSPPTGCAHTARVRHVTPSRGIVRRPLTIRTGAGARDDGDREGP